MLNSNTQGSQTGSIPANFSLNSSAGSSASCGVSLPNILSNNNSGSVMLMPQQQPQLQPQPQHPQQHQQMQNLMFNPGPMTSSNMSNNIGAFAPPPPGTLTFGAVQSPQQHFFISQQPSMVMRGGFPGSPPQPTSTTYPPSAFVPTGGGGGGGGGGGSTVFSTPVSPPLLQIAIPTPSNHFNMSALRNNLGSPMSPGSGAGTPLWNSPPQSPGGGYFSQVPSIGFPNFSLTTTSPRHQPPMPYSPPNQAFMRTGQSTNNMMTSTTATTRTMMMNNPPFSTGMMTSNNNQQQQHQQGTSTSPRPPTLMFRSVAESFQQQQQQQLQSTPSSTTSPSTNSSTVTPSNSLPSSPRIQNPHPLNQSTNLMSEERTKMSISPQLKRKTSSPAMGTCNRCGNNRSNQGNAESSACCTCVEGSSPKLHHMDRKSLQRVSDKTQQSSRQSDRFASSTRASPMSSSPSESDVEIVDREVMEEEDEEDGQSPGPEKKKKTQNPSQHTTKVKSATTTSKGFRRQLSRELSDVEEEDQEATEPEQQTNSKNHRPQDAETRKPNRQRHPPIRVQRTIVEEEDEEEETSKEEVDDEGKASHDNNEDDDDDDDDDDDEDYQQDDEEVDEDDEFEEDIDEPVEEDDDFDDDDDDDDDDDEEYHEGDERRRHYRTNSGTRRRTNSTLKYPTRKRRSSTSSLPCVPHAQREFITPTTTSNRLSNMSTSTVPFLKPRGASYGEDPYMDQLSPASLSRKESSNSLVNQFMRYNNVSSPANPITPTASTPKRPQQELFTPGSTPSTGNTNNNNIVGRRNGRGRQQRHESNNEESDDAGGGAQFNGGGGGLGGERRLTITFISLGVRCRFERFVQTYGKNGWIIPHNLSGTHKMYSQEWKFLVTHEMCMDTVVVRWTVTNLASGSVTSVAETPRQANIRQIKGNTICNVVLQKAMSHRAEELETDAAVHGIPENRRNNLHSLARELRPKKCTEGLLFFGLRHIAVQLPDATTTNLSSSSSAAVSIAAGNDAATTADATDAVAPTTVGTRIIHPTSSAETSEGTPAASGATVIATLQTTATVLSDAATLGSERSPTTAVSSSSSSSPLLNPPSLVPTQAGTYDTTLETNEQGQ